MGTRQKWKNGQVKRTWCTCARKTGAPLRHDGRGTQNACTTGPHCAQRQAGRLNVASFISSSHFSKCPA
ncbi:hypothetical protein PanWU01x14_159620 [Parasponia andersonii]|uniref:Uncharacterized protein n=1 Tax=Parasponia andersonii TaxID=3476 RepID=A0A2P5CEH1_PARAD|nr:hypothetical protein PanWU01x14_159620 [Parasponia andersonii]